MMKSAGDEVKTGPGLNISSLTYLMGGFNLTSLYLISSPLSVSGSAVRVHVMDTRFVPSAQ